MYRLGRTLPFQLALRRLLDLQFRPSMLYVGNYLHGGAPHEHHDPFQPRTES